jgi:predicted DNA-binding protein
MTRQEIEKRIEDLEDRRFALAMCDRWTQADYDLNDKLLEEIRILKEQLKAM